MVISKPVLCKCTPCGFLAFISLLAELSVNMWIGEAVIQKSSRLSTAVVSYDSVVSVLSSIRTQEP